MYVVESRHVWVDGYSLRFLQLCCISERCHSNMGGNLIGYHQKQTSWKPHVRSMQILLRAKCTLTKKQEKEWGKKCAQQWGFFQGQIKLHSAHPSDSAPGSQLPSSGDSLASAQASPKPVCGFKSQLCRLRTVSPWAGCLAFWMVSQLSISCGCYKDWNELIVMKHLEKCLAWNKY